LTCAPGIIQKAFPALEQRSMSARFPTLERSTLTHVEYPLHGSDEINLMKRDEAIQRLQSIKSQGLQVFRLLEEKPRSAASDAEIRNRTAQLRGELESEYARTLPTRVQKSMSIFELSIYSPTIEETWKDTGIRRLKLDGAINGDWSEVFEAVVYKISKYLAQ
jgi:hypothetical protein